MADEFSQIPNWDSAKNQGAGLAAADLDGDGRPELIVLRVDQPAPGPNASFYRVGRQVDAQGTVTGGWGPWREVPNWASNENQGTGIAVADLDGDGRPELIVFQVEHRVPGPNRGLYRIGRKLDAQGDVTGGWSPWRKVPGWVSWQNQGAAIAVADLDGDGQMELIVFHIDDFHTNNPTRPNKGFYRVGKALNADGQVAGWGDWIEVDWSSWFNQGAGLAVADLDNNGRPELIVFQIDNPPGENAGWYRIGWNLDQEGSVQDGWGPWAQVGGWDSWEDAGGGLALADLDGNGRPEAIVLHVDNREGLNKGRFRALPLEIDLDQAAQQGVWRLLPYFSEVLPVHAALLHTGKVLFFAGSGNSFVRAKSPGFVNNPQQIATSVVWDFVHNTFEHPPTLRRPGPSGQANGRPLDFFCCGHCFLPDGRILVAGGTDKYDKETAKNEFFGLSDAVIFNPDPAPGKWKAIRPMAHGRWYPTLVMLGDGRVVVAAGTDEEGDDNDTIEVKAVPDQTAWAKARDFGLPLYPHLFLLRDGRLFFTGGKMDTDGLSVPFLFEPLLPTQSKVVEDLRDTGRCNQCASVILPPAQDQKIMILGGGPKNETEATDRVDIIDFADLDVRYRPAARLVFNRIHVNAVLLPDRTVLAVGGGDTREASGLGPVAPQLARERLVAERFDPSLGPQDQWQKLAAAQVARLYHSVALLLPDGRVVAAGGNPDKGSHEDWLPPDPLEEMRLEIYSPPYLFQKAQRPVIEKAPHQVAYGDEITIATPQAGEIQWVSLIRPGLTTHSFNGEQRLVDIPFEVVGENLQATVTNERNLAPPGWYMLFLVDNDGVPSEAAWVRLQ